MSGAPGRAVGRRPRIVATDLDGTLLDADGLVSARTASVLHRLVDEGIEVIFVTARPPRWLDGLVDAVADHGVVICLNGALVLDVAHRRVLEVHPIADEVVAQVAADVRRELPGATFALERGAGFAAEHTFPAQHPVPAGSPMAGRVEDLLDGATAKLLVRCPAVSDADLTALLDAAVGTRAVVMDSGAHGLGEIAALGVSKATSLAAWVASRGVEPRDVWAFGDMPNDLPMLRWAGRALAVANAHPRVLAEADEVCGAHTDDGVARRLEELVLSWTGDPGARPIGSTR